MLIDLDIKNELYVKLGPVAAKWKRFGVQLGFDLSDLNKLAPQNRASQDCFQEMMQYWIDNGSHQWKVSYSTVRSF